MKKPSLTKFKNSFRTRSFRAGGYSVAATLIVIAMAVVVNIMAAALPAKYTQIDTTAAQLFTISDETEKLAASLDADVTIYWVTRSGYEDTYIGSLLDRYASLSGRIKVVKKDPDVYPTFVEQYCADGLNNNSLVVVSGDRYRYVDYYDIYVYDYDYYTYYYTGEYDVSFDGEAALTSAIDYVVSEDLPKVYLLTGHGESSLSTTFSSALSKENVETQTLSLITTNAIPEDADCIFLYAPQSDIAQQELALLQEYLQNGGRLMLVTDPPQDAAFPNLYALMESYGVTAQEGIVVEGSQNYYAWGTPYYLLPAYGSHDITAPLEENGYYVLLPIAQGLTVSDDLPEGVAVTELLTTSSSAFSKLAGYSLTSYEKEDGDIGGPFALGVAVTDSNSGASIVWVSSAALLDDETDTYVSGGNQDLFLNAMGWLCEPEESSYSIHAKSLDQEYLTIDSGTVSGLTALMLGCIPLAVLGVGIIIVIGRKRR